MDIKRKIYKIFIITFLLAAVFIISGCEKKTKSNHDDSVHRSTNLEILTTKIGDSQILSSDNIIIDASYCANGYISIKYTGDSKKVKIQITGPTGEVYTYSILNSNEYTYFPMTQGSGLYHIDILENVIDTMYALIYSTEINVNLLNEFDTYLYPNQYVWYTPDSEAVKLGIKLSENSSNDLDYIDQVYSYVINNIKYNNVNPDDIPIDYIPDIDKTLKNKSGICFDYASLMAAILRSQSVPTKLVFGYSGTEYHAWIDVYTKETGWIDGVIEFDGSEWSLIDPTLGANNDSESVKEYIKQKDLNYLAKFQY